MPVEQGVVRIRETVAFSLPTDITVDKTAIGAPHRSGLTYPALAELVRRVGAQLRAAGITSDDRVALLAANGPEAATAFLAIASACPCVPLNPGFTEPELMEHLTGLNARLLVHTDAEPPAAAAALGIPTAWMEVDSYRAAGMFALPQLPASEGDVVITPPATALLLHTSGTSSRPKLVPLTWGNLRAGARNFGATLRLTPDDRCLNVLPLFHIGGLVSSVLATLGSGGSVVCTPGFVAPRFFEWMDQFAPTWYAAVPAMHQAIVARAPAHAASLRRSRLRFTRSLSAPLSPELQCALEATFGVPVVNTYGMTEAAGQIASTAFPPARRKAGSVGQAAGPELAILADDGTSVQFGQQGEICVRGPNVMSGYLDNAAANQASFCNGWLRTGDLGHIDADGFLFVSGRARELINRGGEKISPHEIDEVIGAHPAVHQCVSFALPDSQLGEEIGVLAVVRSGAVVDEAALQHFAAARLAAVKVPRRVLFAEDIPKTHNGKVQRIGLAARLGITTDSWKPHPPEAVSADDLLTGAVARVMAEVLGVAEVPPDVRFFDAGADSLLAAQLLVRIESEFGKRLSLVDLFRASSARAVAATLSTAVVQPPRAAAAKAVLPTLSSGQVRLWLHDQFEDSLTSHTARLFELRAVSPEQVRRVLADIIGRHEPLRTVIRLDGGAPRAHLRPVEPMAWEIHDWSATPPGQRETSARQICDRETARLFQLETDLMLRGSLHHLGDGRWWLLVVMHHAATDGWSWEVFQRELQAGLAGQPLPALTATYSDFARWQQATLTSERLAVLRAYWAAQLAGLPPLLELPLEFPRPARQTFRGRWVSSVVPAAVAADLRELGRARGATLFMTLLAGWTGLLNRYSGSADIAVGTPAAGRGKVDFENLIGVFMNTLVLRTRLDGDPSFTDLLDRVRTTCLGAWDHNLPFADLLTAAPPVRSPAHSPYFQVYFQLRNFPHVPGSAAYPIGLVELDVEAVFTDLNMEIAETPAGLHLRLAYNTALFTDAYARAVLEHFQVLLRGAIAAPEAPVSQLPLLGAEERTTLIARRLPPQRPRAETTVVALFERVAARHCDEIAVLFRDGSLTYGELNRSANRLARVLAAAGVGPERTVAVCMERSSDWIIAILAVAKAGGVYLPIDPHYPVALVRDRIGRGGASVAIVDNRGRDALQGTATTVIWTGDWPRLTADHDDTDAALAARPDHLAHVFFTSGSTGRAKAVAIEHRNLSAYLDGYHWMKCSPSDTCLQFTSISFDPSAGEVWGPLTQGGRCAVYAEGLDDPARLADWIRVTRVTTCYFSTSVFNMLIDDAPHVLQTVRRVLIGGEALSVPHVRRALDLLPRTELINGYGPTETTIYYTAYPIPRPFDPAWSTVPIGRPLDNGRAYIMDPQGQLVPDGLPGELWLGGDSMGRGYLDEPDLSAAAFPTASITAARDTRLYRTGDRARWRPDGELEFLGRRDHQVKVRGVRIELGEIEAVLREHSAVLHAAVIATPHPTAGNTLTAFVQLQAGAAASAPELRTFLSDRLPIQMVPSAIDLPGTLPLTASGKIDRQVLAASALHRRQHEPVAKPMRDRAASGGQRSSPIDDVDRRLAEIWKDLLGVSAVLANDNFFELGGHSLLAVRLVCEIERQFAQRVTLVSLVEVGTLAGMAGLIRGCRRPGHRTAAAAAEPVAAVPPLLCIGAGPLFRPLAQALGARCRFESVPTPGALQGIATMEELAACVIPTIHDAHPRGPLIVAGWSLAGVVAIEVAAQLERAGRDVRRVILFDSLSPVRLRRWFAPSPRLRQWQLDFVKARYHLEEAIACGPREALRYVARTVRDARARRGYDAMLRDAASGKKCELDVPLDFRFAFGPYAARYSPAPLRAQIILVRPERRKKGALFNGDLGWAELGYKVDVLTVPGDHDRMFAPNNAPVLAERLLDELGR